MKVTAQEHEPRKKIVIEINVTTAMHLLEAIGDDKIRPHLWGDVKDLENALIEKLNEHA